MVYPNEISRLSKTTASGTPYIELSVYPYGITDKALVCIPTSLADGEPVTLAVCAHGSGGSEITINSAMMTATRDGMIDRGWVVSSAFAHDRAWSNSAAMADYRRVYDWVDDTWPVAHTLLHGQSMGGLTVMNMYSAGTIPKVRGSVSIDGALNLAQAFGQAYASEIRTAYGIAVDGSDYATRTAGHDAVLQAPASFAGKRLLLSASAADTAIPKTSHSDLFYSNMTGQPAVMQYLTGTGGHTTTPNYFPTEVLAFYEAAIAAAPTAPDYPDPSPLPEGLELVQLYMADPDGVLFKIDPVGLTQ